jgi:hypothetical protein
MHSGVLAPRFRRSSGSETPNDQIGLSETATGLSYTETDQRPGASSAGPSFFVYEEGKEREVSRF